MPGGPLGEMLQGEIKVFTEEAEIVPMAKRV